MAQTTTELDAAFAQKIKTAADDLNGLMQRASVAGIKIDVDVTTRHHIGLPAAPVITVSASRQL